jgi:hypothetical protein
MTASSTRAQVAAEAAFDQLHAAVRDLGSVDRARYHAAFEVALARLEEVDSATRRDTQALPIAQLCDFWRSDIHDAFDEFERSVPPRMRAALARYLRSLRPRRRQ